jgi:hypothetical protein
MDLMYLGMMIGLTKRKILFIGGSLNQTTMLHRVAQELADHECYFTPYYCDGSILKLLERNGFLDFTPIGGRHKLRTEDYLRKNDLRVDYGGTRHDYDLVVTSSDLLIQKNIRRKNVVLVQEGMTDPENIMYFLVKHLGLPRYLASTSTTGMSDAYVKFCVASDGYRDLFIQKGGRPEKLVVTGLPNFDNLKQYLTNTFPLRQYVLVATSDARETYKLDNRRRFLKKCLRIADGRPLMFRLHPNERTDRARSEIEKYAPGSLVFTSGSTEEMVANCDVLITQYSTVVYVGLALGKECHSYFDIETLRRLLPVQNNGTSAANIAHVCLPYLHRKRSSTVAMHPLPKNGLKGVLSRLAPRPSV